MDVVLDKSSNGITWSGNIFSAGIENFFPQKEEVNLAKILYVKKIYADPAKKTTVVVWADGTKTKVKCSDEDVYSLEAGFWAALAKKVYGSYEDYSRFFNHRKVVITSKANL